MPGLCVATENILGGGEGGECEKAVVLKGASAIGSQLWGEVFTPEEGGTHQLLSL